MRKELFREQGLSEKRGFDRGRYLIEREAFVEMGFSERVLNRERVSNIEVGFNTEKGFNREWV